MDISMIGKFFEKDKGLLEGLQSGINIAQSGGQDTGDLISQALQSLQDNQQKYGEKAMKAEEKARKYSMIGNILGGVGALANTVNMAYQGIKHSRRGLPIGDPAVQFGSSLSGQGDDLRKDAQRYEMMGVRDPLKMLAIQQAQQKQDLHPLQREALESEINYRNKAAANLGQKPSETERLLAILSEGAADDFRNTAALGSGEAGPALPPQEMERRVQEAKVAEARRNAAALLGAKVSSVDREERLAKQSEANLEINKERLALENKRVIMAQAENYRRLGKELEVTSPQEAKKMYDEADKLLKFHGISQKDMQINTGESDVIDLSGL